MKKIIISSVMMLALFTIACGTRTTSSAGKSNKVATTSESSEVDGHPMEMERKECITCHSDPEMVSDTSVVEEYNMSMHSFAGVACGNCHGDENDFRKIPSRASCEPCHSEQVANVNSSLECQSCHIPHTYNVHMKR